MKGDQGTEVGADLGGGLETGGLGSSVSFGRGNVGGLRVVLQITKAADGEKIPRGALVAKKDKILGSFHGAREGVFHLPLFF